MPYISILVQVHYSLAINFSGKLGYNQLVFLFMNNPVPFWPLFFEFQDGSYSRGPVDIAIGEYDESKYFLSPTYKFEQVCLLHLSFHFQFSQTARKDLGLLEW